MAGRTYNGPETRTLKDTAKGTGCNFHPYATNYDGVCLQCFRPRDTSNILELRGEGFKVFADIVDPDPKNPIMDKDRDMIVVRHTLATKFATLIPHKVSLTVKYKGVIYVVNRRRDYILISNETENGD